MSNSSNTLAVSELINNFNKILQARVPLDAHKLAYAITYGVPYDKVSNETKQEVKIIVMPSLYGRTVKFADIVKLADRIKDLSKKYKEQYGA